MSDVLDGAVAPVEPVATPEPVAPAPASTAEQEAEIRPDEAKEDRQFTQKELDDILQKRLAKEYRRFERQANERAELMARALAAERQLEAFKPPAPQVSDGKPQLSQFQDYESYTEALTDWKVKQTIEQREAKQREAYQQHTQAQQKQEAVKEVKQKFGAILESKPDVADIVLDEHFPISDPMLGAMMSSDVGEKLLEYIAHNKSKAAEIYALPPAAQFRKVMELEAQLRVPSARTTNAPEPVKPVGTGPALQKSLEKMTQKEFEAHLAKAVYGR